MKSFSPKTLKLAVISCLVLGLSSCSTESLHENIVYDSNELITSALSLCHQNNQSDGLLKLEKVMTNEKTNPFYWNALGICFALSNKPLKANFYYDLGIEALSSYKGSDKKQIEAAILNNIGLIHLSFKRFNDAFSLFKKAEKLSPLNFSIQGNIAQVLLEFKYDDKALAILEKLENTKSGDRDVLYSIALIYSRKNDFENALLALSKIKPQETTRADVSGIYAYNLVKTNQLQLAFNVIKNRQSADEYNSRNKILEKEISAKYEEFKEKEKEKEKLKLKK